VALTLDVWTSKLVDAGEELTRARMALLEQLQPELLAAYQRLAGREATVTAVYQSSWLDRERAGEQTMELGLAAALEAARGDELRRRVSLVGPHRDDVELTLDGLPARTHASQGEQRTLALAMRLAAHQVVTTAAGTPPLLLLDDVFSELDPDRSRALVESLGSAQTLLTTAGPLPPGAVPERVLRIADGAVHPG
jgi:DNA replication and repair protein RecF